MIPKFISDYFLLTNKERKGILVIVIVILVASLLPFLFPYFIKEDLPDTEKFEKKLAELRAARADSTQELSRYDNEFAEDYSPAFSGTKASYTNFIFDPNTASQQEWEKLGIKQKTIRTIENYRSKGGKFYKPADLKKIYGLSPKDAERLMPFVVIRDRHDHSEGKANPQSSVITEKKITPDLVNINTADTNQLKRLPGIGSKLSQRIVNFRDKLGGFYSVNQVAEVYLLPDSVFKKIKPMLLVDENAFRKLDLNEASFDQLKSHPYIDNKLSKAIVAYREQHGNFKSTEDLKNIMLVSGETFEKLNPYLSVK